MKKIAVIMIALILVFSSSAAFAVDDAANVIGDAMLLRPLGVVALTGGLIVYVVSLPIAAITKSTDKTYEALVKEPYEYVFVRPIGEIGSGL